MTFSTEQLRAQISEAKALLDSDPADADALQLMGRAYLRLGMMIEAKECYERALTIDPHDPWSHLYLGNVHYFLRAYGEALQAFSRARDVAPHLAMPHKCLGDVLNCLGDNAEAEAMYRKGFDLDPSCFGARQSLEAFLVEKRIAGSDGAQHGAAADDRPQAGDRG